MNRIRQCKCNYTYIHTKCCHQATLNKMGFNIYTNDKHREANGQLVVDPVLAMINQQVNGQTPLTYAFLDRDVNLVKLLLSKGAQLGTSPSDDFLVFDLCDESSNQLLELAIEADANVHATTPDGKNALFTSVARADLKSAALLIEQKIDVNQVDNDGVTVLRRAIEAKLSFEWFELLLAAGADPMATIGTSPLSAFAMMCLDYPVGATRYRVVQMMLGDKPDKPGANSVENASTKKIEDPQRERQCTGLPQGFLRGWTPIVHGEHS